MAKSNEPVWWSLFAAGGVTAAFLIPAAILITGVAIPFGWMTSDELYALIHHPLVRLILFAAIAPTLFHGAHRTLHTLVELGLKPARAGLAFLLYGGAILGTLLTAYLLIRMGR